MKKIILILAALALISLLCMSACDSGNTPAETTGPSDTTAAETTAAPEITTPSPETTAPAPAKITYKVTVVDQNGDAVKGVEVQMCDDAGCKLPAPTAEDGTVTFTYAESNYHITLVTIPEGYTADTAAQYDFPEGSTELTVTITKN